MRVAQMIQTLYPKIVTLQHVTFPRNLPPLQLMTQFSRSASFAAGAGVFLSFFQKSDTAPLMSQRSKQSFPLANVYLGHENLFMYDYHPLRFFRLIIPTQYCSHHVNVVCDGSPSRIRMVLRISLGMTTRPRSSMRRTMPVAFIPVLSFVFRVYVVFP